MSDKSNKSTVLSITNAEKAAETAAFLDKFFGTDEDLAELGFRKATPEEIEDIRRTIAERAKNR